MRVINKDGTIDIPYKGTALEVKYNNYSPRTGNVYVPKSYWTINAYSSNYYSNHYNGYRILGYYETKEKAVDDLYNLRISYIKGEDFYVLSGETGVTEMESSWNMIEIIIKIIFCHLVGDYVLQGEFIAKTKGENWYHLIVHCLLYILPFYILFGLDWRLSIILVTHIIIDALKARYKKINYITDQLLHYLTAVIVYTVMN